MQIIQAQAADQLWLAMASQFSNEEAATTYESRGGRCSDLGRVSLLLADPRQRWVVSRVPAINPAFALAECVWILTGRHDLAFLEYFNTEYPRFVGNERLVYGAYGFRLKHSSGIDQLERAYSVLRCNQSSRQVVLQIWQVGLDIPHSNGQPASMDIPCNVVSMLKVRNHVLEWTQVLRSNDVFLGLPYNFVQFTTLHEVMSGWLGIEPGTYCHIADSMHCYETDLPRTTSLSVHEAPPNEDSLAFSKQESDRWFTELGNRIDGMREQTLTKPHFEDLLSWTSAPRSIQNVLMVIGAESSRRRRWNMECEIMKECSNQLFQQLFTRWVDSLRGRTSRSRRSH